MGIIERLATVWFVSAGIIIAGAAVWRYFGPPVLNIEPNWWNINRPIPQVQWVASNFGTYELVNIEKNDGAGTWTPITSAPLRANIWGYAELITPSSPSTGLQLGTIEYRAVGLETGKIAYNNVTVSNVDR